METGDDITKYWTKPTAGAGTILNDTPGAEPQTQPPEQPATPEPESTQLHPITQFMDFVIYAAEPICINKGLEPPNTKIYDSVTRDAVNQAAWAYLPNMSGGEESPKWLILLLAIGGMGMVLMPTVLSYLSKKSEQKEIEEAEETQQLPNETNIQPQQPITPENLNAVVKEYESPATITGL